MCQGKHVESGPHTPLVVGDFKRTTAKHGRDALRRERRSHTREREYYEYEVQRREHGKESLGSQEHPSMRWRSSWNRNIWSPRDGTTPGGNGLRQDYTSPNGQSTDGRGRGRPVLLRQSAASADNILSVAENC